MNMPVLSLNCLFFDIQNMKYMIRFSKSPVPGVLALKNGIISFRCVCGSIGESRLSEFTEKTRCRRCFHRNLKLLKKKNKLTEKELEELFDFMFENGIRYYLETNEKQTKKD